MDILGSILGSMEKPPVLEDKERKKAREQKALFEKHQQQEKAKLQKFKVEIQKRVGNFIKDGTKQSFKFEHMDKVLRAIVHEVADVAGLTSFSFGQEEEDRYIMIWKKEFAPCDDELTALRNGQEWDPAKARLDAAAKEEAKKCQMKRKHDFQPNVDYHRKYEHILGKESAKDAARLTLANKSYGFVPSENKRDQRTIEQVMADSQARKRSKLDSSHETGAPSTSTRDDNNEVSEQPPQNL